MVPLKVFALFASCLPTLGAIRHSLRGLERDCPGPIDRLLQNVATMPAFVNNTQFNCPWQASVTTKTYNFGANDANVIYQFMIHFGVNATNIIRISGSIPKKVRYFSFQTYRYTGGQHAENVSLLSNVRDDELIPASGINVYSMAKPSAREINLESTYVVHVTPSGKQGLENELRLLDTHESDDICETIRGGCIALVLLRFYHAKPYHDAIQGGYSEEELWGNVARPDAYVRNKDGNYDLIPPCLPDQPTLIQQIIQHRLEELNNRPHPDNFTYFTTPNNFVMFTSSAYLPNTDTAYLIATGEYPKDNTDIELLAKVTGQLPVYSRGVVEPPYVGDADSYDVRYSGFSILWASALAPSTSSVSDATFEAFYKEKRSVKEWDRKYSLVMGPSLELAQKCQGIYDEDKDFFVSSTPKYIDPILVRPEKITVVLRQLAPTPRFYKNSTLWLKHFCEETNGCKDPTYIKEVMGDYYPQIQWYYCDTKTGEATKVDKEFPREFGKPVPLSN